MRKILLESVGSLLIDVIGYVNDGHFSQAVSYIKAVACIAAVTRETLRLAPRA